MVYFRLTKKLCSNRKLFQCISVLLLVAVFWMILFGSSVVKYRYRFYEPFKDDLNAKGISCGADFMQTNENGNVLFVRDRNELKNYLNDVTSIYASYQLIPMYHEYHQISAWSYDPELIQKYTPELAEGRWLDPNCTDDNMIETVVYNPKGNIHCGDIITLTEDNIGFSLDVKVVGVLDDEALVYGFDDDSLGNTVHSFYVSPKDLINNGPYKMEMDFSNNYIPDVFLFNNANLSNYKIVSETASGDVTEIQRAMSGMVFVFYKDSITEQTIEENNEKLSDSFLYQKISLSERRDNSKKFIYEQLRLLLPLAICGFVLLLIALMSYEVFNFSNQLKSLAVFFICGMDWKKSVLICFFHNCIIHIIAFLVFIISYIFVVMECGVKMKFCTINLGWILSVLLVVALNHILSVCIPLIILKNKQPKNLLYNN